MSRHTKPVAAAARWATQAFMTGLSQRSTSADELAPPPSAQLTSLCRRAAADGCVLLVNDDQTLPLSPSDEVAVFGRCQLDWFFMGHGSGGDVNPPYTTNLIDGINSLKARHNQVLSELYRIWTSDVEHAADPGFWAHWPQSLPEMPVTTELAEAAASTADIALVVIGRNAGEGQDMALAKGAYYLSDDERALLDVVTQAFDRTIVVVNSSNLIDFSWTEDFGHRISAILLANQGGMEAGRAVADVLYGRVCPSGRLTATVAKTWEDYPSAKTFGRRRIDYDEGVFVGYRHFGTHAPDRVLFPFGHGLSYTSFAVVPFDLEREGERVVSRISVTNIGNVRGATSVLLWCELAEGRLEKPRRVLVAFDKTAELSRDECQELTLSFDLRTVASFDEQTRAFTVEAGTYVLYANDAAAGSFEIANTLVINRCEHFCGGPAELRLRILERMPHEVVATGDRQIPFSDVAEGKATLTSFVAQLSDAELADLTRGEGMMDSKLGPAGNAGAFGGVTEALRSRGVPAAICADGPSGLRLSRTCSLLPSATTLACTFDQALVEHLYFLVGKEVASTGVDVLLAPGMNIQRSVRCGRNFEYFSEDPLLTGRMAASVVRGLQTAGVSACPKHFAANNQERRRQVSDSRVSERALREIYLRAFEICVRESAPDLIMCAYNRLNGTYCHCHYDLVTTTLRHEWGFTGLIITDWWPHHTRSPEFPHLHDNAYRVRAGVDVLMPGNLDRLPVGTQPDLSIMLASRAELQRSALQVLSYLLPRSLRMERGE